MSSIYQLHGISTNVVVVRGFEDGKGDGCIQDDAEVDASKLGGVIGGNMGK